MVEIKKVKISKTGKYSYCIVIPKHYIKERKINPNQKHDIVLTPTPSFPMEHSKKDCGGSLKND